VERGGLTGGAKRSLCRVVTGPRRTVQRGLNRRAD
jgi:hypothetical protein